MSTKKTANPTSPARIAANRANARKSTGPRTPQGKARSSRNALKHGLLARHAVITDDPAEDRDAFEELLNQLTAEYRPVGPTQCLLVERIAVCYWRLRRALRYEADCVHNDRVVGRGCGPHEGLIYTKYDAAGSRGVLPVGPDFDRLIRYETMIDRQLNRLMAHLDHLRNSPSTDGLESHTPAPRAQQTSPSAPLDIGASDFIGHSDLVIRHSPLPRLANSQQMKADNSCAPNEPNLPPSPAPNPQPVAPFQISNPPAPPQPPPADTPPPGIRLIKRI